MIQIEQSEFPIQVNLDNARTQYYSNYSIVFPTPEARLAHAEGLVPTDGSEARPNPNLTWSLLASHWADPDETAFQLAWRMFNLRPAMAKYRGETVMQLSGFDPRQLRPESGALPPDISIEDGTLNPSLEQKALDAVAIHYQFRRPRRLELAANVQNIPFMDFTVGLATSTNQLVTTDSNHELNVTPYTDFPSTVTAFTGRVCLADSSELYRATSASRLHHVAFGNNKAYNLLSSIVETVGGEPQQRFKELIAAGEIRSNKPLPDLEFLAIAS
jgi:hypothetical protein